MDILKDDLEFFRKLIPEFVKKNTHIIGLENYSDLKTIELALKLLPYVLNFSFGVYARRQMINNSEKQKKIMINMANNRESIMSKPITDNESLEEIVFGS